MASGRGKTEAREGEIGGREVMKKFFSFALALTAVLAISPAAKADSFDDNIATTGGLAGDLLFSINPSRTATDGSFDIKTGIANVPARDYDLVSGADVGGTIIANIGEWSDQFHHIGAWTLSDSDGASGLPITAEMAPEPSSLSMLGSGLFLLAGGLFWKSRLKAHLAKQLQPNVNLAA
jgi:hypothetical protein